MPLTIRPLAASDEADWRRLWTGYLAFYETTLPEAIYQSSFARLIAPEITDYHGLIADLTGAPSG